MDNEPITSETQTTNTIPDEVLVEFEKVSKLEKSLTFLQFRQGSVEQSLTKLQEEIAATSNPKEKEKEKNVISEEIKENKEEPSNEEEDNQLKKDKVKPQLDSIEKKRYEEIGKEFIKGVSQQFTELEKAQKLKDKMSTTTKKELEKKEVKESNKNNKKIGFFAKLSLILGTLGILYILFKDKLEGMFPSVKTKFPKISEGIGNIFDKFGEIFYNIFGISFGGTFTTFISTKIPPLLTTFFYYILPASLERAVLAVMASFSENARNRYNSGEVSFDTNFEAAQRKFDQDTATRNATEDYLRLSSGQFEGSQLLAAKGRAHTGAFLTYDAQANTNTSDMLAQMFGSSIFGVDTSTADGLNSVKSFIFDSNHPIARTMITAMKDNQQLIQDAIAGGLTEEEIKTQIIPMIAQSAGIKTDGSDARYVALQQSVLQTLGTDATQAAKRMSSLIGVLGQYESVLQGEQQAVLRNHSEEEAAARTAALGSIQFQGNTPTIKLLSENVAETTIAAEVHDFFKTITDTFANPKEIIDKHLNTAINVLKTMYSEFIGKGFGYFDQILSMIPTSLYSPNYDLGNVLGIVEHYGQHVNWTLKQEIEKVSQHFEARDFAFASGIQSAIVVNLSLMPSFVDKLATLTSQRKETLATLETTNSKLIEIVEIVKNKENINGNFELIETKINEFKTTTTKLLNDNFANQDRKIETNSSRIGNIEKYLEDQDGVEDDGRTKDFVLQATAS